MFSNFFAGGVFSTSRNARHAMRHAVRHAKKPTRELNAAGAEASCRGVKACSGHSFKMAETKHDVKRDVGALRHTAHMRLDVYIVAPPRLGLRHAERYVELSRNVKRGKTQRRDVRRDAQRDTPSVTQKTHPRQKFFILLP